MSDYSSRRSSVPALSISFVLLFVALLGVSKRQAIYDAYRLRNYQPSAKVAQLASDDTMNSAARRLFYVYHPDLQDRTSFGQNCPVNREQTIVLGCYIQQKGIYLFHVTEPRLSGVLEVTAAHEMLHAAYDRLSSSEKQRIDGLIAEAFENLHDERLSSTVENYRKHDAQVVPNELHSILATEVRSLPAELEQYYKRYFDDRSKIVAYSDRYEQEFVSRKSKVAADDASLGTLKIRIEDNERQLDQLNVRLQSSRQKLDQLRTSDRVVDYNAQVPIFNQQVQSYNALVTTTKQLIESYNNLVIERNAVAQEQQQLIQALDSQSPTLQTQ